MKKILSGVLFVAASLLSACGGGGGSPGSSNLEYKITVTSAKSQLPINVGGEGPGIGAYARFTTTMYVQATEGGRAIQGGEDIFGCAVTQGLDSGILYYLDGDTEHEDDNGNPAAFRAITLGANSGGATFHLHALNKAGTVRVTCSVTNPSDKLVSTASVDVVVGAQTGMAANVIGTTQVPGYLGTQWNTSSIRNNVVISSLIMDDANQPIPDPKAANLKVRIRPFGASAGARLVSGSQSGAEVQVKTIGGEGQVSLSSGPSAGTILLELITDRFDNDVTNGLQDPIIQLLAVGVHKAIASEPLAITTTDQTVTVGLPYSFALTAQGGVPPYVWSSSGLPAGLSLSADGIISGTPVAKAGAYKVLITVTDETGAVVTKNLTITVQGNLAIDGCSADVATPCVLPGGKVGDGYSYTLSFSIGDPTIPVVWSISGNLPAGLSFDAATGTISGTPTMPGTYIFVVTAKRGSLTVSRQVSISVS